MKISMLNRLLLLLTGLLASGQAKGGFVRAQCVGCALEQLQRLRLFRLWIRVPTRMGPSVSNLSSMSGSQRG